MVAALLLMNGSASTSTPASMRASAVTARADRSAVPMLPNSRTAGSERAGSESAGSEPASSNARRASSTAGETPLPPAASWFSRTTSMALTRSGERSGPAEVA